MTTDVEQLYHQIIELANSGECAGATHLFSRLGNTNTLPLAVRLKMVHCQAKLGIYEVAIPDPVESLSAFEAAAWIEAAQSLEQAGRTDLAALMFDRLIAMPSMPDPFRGHALWHAVVGRLAYDPQVAESLIHQLLAYEGTDPPAPMLWGKAIECIAYRSRVDAADVERIWNKLPVPTAEPVAGVLMQAAFTLECRGHLDAARFGYESLTSMDGVPNTVLVNARLRLGIVLDALGLWGLAVREYEAAAGIQCAPNVAQSQAAFRLAQAREAAEEYSEAAGLFALLRSDTFLDQLQRAQAQLRYAMCLLRAGDKEGALDELEICRQAGGDAALKSDMAQAEIHESNRDAGKARACYERVLANPAAEPATKAAAVSRLQRLKR
jgi:tetratricopeptide (TPR) repeat protein